MLFEITLVDIVEDAKPEEGSNVLLNLKRDFFDLTLKANGKLELYFHAYFWTQYIGDLLKKSGLPAEGIKDAVQIAQLSNYAAKP